MRLLKFKRLVKYVLRNKLNIVDDLILSQMLLERLEELPKEGWLYYEREFNHWKFPEAFYDLIPSWYNPKENNTDRLMVIHGKAMRRVHQEFTREQMLRFHNVNCGTMTDDEFTYWFNMTDIINSEYYPRERKFKSINFWEDETWNKLKSTGLVFDTEVNPTHN